MQKGVVGSVANGKVHAQQRGNCYSALATHACAGMWAQPDLSTFQEKSEIHILM